MCLFGISGWPSGDVCTNTAGMGFGKVVAMTCLPVAIVIITMRMLQIDSEKAGSGTLWSVRTKIGRAFFSGVYRNFTGCIQVLRLCCVFAHCVVVNQLGNLRHSIFPVLHFLRVRPFRSRGVAKIFADNRSSHSFQK